MHLRRVAAAVVAAHFCVNCASPTGAEDTQQPDSPERLEHDLGGPAALLDFFSTASEADIRQLLEEYGMQYQEHVVPRSLPGAIDKDIAACPKNFPSSDRSTWHAFDGEFYYVDGSGRPAVAYKYLPPISSAPRSSSCQGKIGGWGDAENPSNNYDGGHLIGSQLGGWGKRANIVPQDANFNRGNWAQLENKMAKCGGIGSGRLLYKASAGYPNGSKLVPNTMGLFLKDMVQGDSIALSFQNVDYGGSNGTNQRQQGVSFLSAQGCN